MRERWGHTQAGDGIGTVVPCGHTHFLVGFIRVSLVCSLRQVGRQAGRQAGREGVREGGSFSRFEEKYYFRCGENVQY